MRVIGIDGIKIFISPKAFIGAIIAFNYKISGGILTLTNDNGIQKEMIKW